MLKSSILESQSKNRNDFERNIYSVQTICTYYIIKVTHSIITRKMASKLGVALFFFETVSFNADRSKIILNNSALRA